MGVKHFFIWLRKNFPDTIQTIGQQDTFNTHDIEVDNLCLDMNGIFHSCAQKIYEYGAFEKKSLLIKQKYKKGLRWQMSLFAEICENIDRYVKMVKPRKRLILCIDGVAGKAKMNQQRQRRYRSEALDNCDFDTSSITPGTKFMEHLSRYIEWYIRIMISNTPDWENLDIIYSNDKVPGEGEHKIINYIRHNKESSDSYCIHGLDADLIMLSLGTRCKNMYVLRENVRNLSELHLINIGKLGTKLAYSLKWDREYPHMANKSNNGECEVAESVATVSVATVSGAGETNDNTSTKDNPTFAKFSSNNSIDDFIFMCFLVGNDFLPTIPTLAILDGGIDSMIDVYKTVGKQYGHLTRISRKNKDITVMFHQEALYAFLATLATYEKGLLEEKYNKKEDIIEDPLITQSMTHTFTKDTDGPVNTETMWSLNFEKYHDLYYSKKLDFTDKETHQEDIDNICEEYIRGLQWVMTYYKKGMPCWDWCYPDFYAPFLCDLAKVVKESENIKNQQTFELGKPIDPFMQLVCVLAPRSHDLLPFPLNNLVGSPASPLKSYYPDSIEIDFTGKRQEWEGIVILPQIDLDVVSRHYTKYLQQVGEFDKRRNISKRSLKFSYEQDESKIYTYKSFYGEITDCRANWSVIDI